MADRKRIRNLEDDDPGQVFNDSVTKSRDQTAELIANLDEYQREIDRKPGEMTLSGFPKLPPREHDALVNAVKAAMDQKIPREDFHKFVNDYYTKSMLDK